MASAIRDIFFAVVDHREEGPEHRCVISFSGSGEMVQRKRRLLPTDIGGPDLVGLVHVQNRPSEASVVTGLAFEIAEPVGDDGHILVLVAGEGIKLPAG
jgi:hypothetical protein